MNRSLYSLTLYPDAVFESWESVTGENLLYVSLLLFCDLFNDSRSSRYDLCFSFVVWNWSINIAFKSFHNQLNLRFKNKKQQATRKVMGKNFFKGINMNYSLYFTICTKRRRNKDEHHLLLHYLKNFSHLSFEHLQIAP